jgi:hypothetical protein
MSAEHESSKAESLDNSRPTFIRNVTNERRGRKGRKEKNSLHFAAFAFAKPKLAESLSSEGWAFAFKGCSQAAIGRTRSEN